MYVFRSFLLSSLVLLLGACTATVEPDEVIGSWDQTFLTIKTVDGEVLEAKPLGTTWFRVDEDGGYIQNYIIGEWEMAGDQLMLRPQDPDLGFELDYTIVRLRKDVLVLESLIRNDRSCCFPDEVAVHDQLIVTERYSRSQE